MSNQWSDFIERNIDVPEVKSALKSAKNHSDIKQNYICLVPFEAEPSGFSKVISTWKLKQEQTEDQNA
ncbi:MAG: hypothetical protein MAG581_02772 [Deltaproteobacteria bacterium]|jgi:hypothetical protein|nr:hypothetical protein [Deltaproteobacteria bacterium]